MRKPIVAGNWKMNKTIGEAQDLVRKLRAYLDGLSQVEVVICPPFTALRAASDALADSSIHLGAQNVHWEHRGAYTGEISPEMLKDAGCEFVILGHSERRQLFGETNQGVSQKIAAVRSVGLIPIVCVGETLAERESDKTFSVIEEQLSNCLITGMPAPADSLVIAYEPVWAIGTGRNATPEQACEVHVFIRNRLREIFGEGVSSRMRILYGGSVNAKNIEALMAQIELDGTLVGGASLEAESFAHIVKSSIRTSHGI